MEESCSPRKIILIVLVFTLTFLLLYCCQNETFEVQGQLLLAIVEHKRRDRVRYFEEDQHYLAVK